MADNKVKISKESVNRFLSLTWYANNYSENKQQNSYYIAKRTQDLVAKNIIGGAAIPQLVKSLTKTQVDAYKYSAERLIRTELVYVMVQVDILTYDR